MRQLDIRRILIEPGPDGPREIGIIRRTILRGDLPPITVIYDPPLPRALLPTARSVIAAVDDA
jgi:hypothetical protein